MTPHLISESTLRHTIKGIIRVLGTKFPQFKLIAKHPYQYYQQAKFIFTRKDAKLYITLKFPITSFAQPLLLYKALSYPHPINQSNTPHASQILDLPNISAIKRDRTLYTTFNYDTLYHCQIDQFITCDQSLAMHSISSKTCLLSLFQNDKSSIFDTCNFRLLPQMIKQSVIELTPTSVLLTNINEIHIKCPNETLMLEGCTFCVQHIPCRCSIQTPIGKYQPRLVNCQEQTQSETRTYPINLALLPEFFGQDKIKQYVGDTYFRHSINITIPDFQIYNHKFKQI